MNTDHLQQIIPLIKDELEATEQLIQTRFCSTVPLVNEVAKHITANGGKRLRPIMLLLAAKASVECTGSHIKLATLIEYIHTATLLHDDVVDNSDMRRNTKTANNKFGNEASILVGDYLYSIAFQMMVDVKNLDIMAILAAATTTLSEGEALQLSHRNNPLISEDDYLAIIRAKTGKLFEAAAQIAATTSDNKYSPALKAYGMHVGTAFQLIDDVLDYSAPLAQMGKNMGNDLAEGYTTLPLIITLQQGTENQKACVSRAITQGSCEDIEIIKNALESTEALSYTMRLAYTEIDKADSALQALPESKYRDALAQLGRFAIERNH